MDFSKILPAIGALAPTLASALGGPLAGLAVSELEKVFGLEPGAAKKDPNALAVAVAGMTPDQAIALRKQEQDFSLRAKELDIDFAKIAAGDRDSARKREVDTKDWTPKALAGLIVVGYLIVQWFLLTHVVAADMREIVMRSLGMLDAALGLVLGYYFGSSAGSSRKDDTIKALAS